MKRIVAIFLSLIMLLSVTPSAYAADTTITMEITSDGEQTITVPTGSEITVTYTLKNNTDDSPFEVRSLYNDIYYDTDFFELVEGSIEAVNSQNALKREYSNGEERVSFNGFHLPTHAIYETPTVIGRFKLKVLAESGSSTVYSTAQYVCYARDAYYDIAPENLTVFVGEEPPAALYNVVYMNNGAVYNSSTAAGIIELSSAPVAPNGYRFLGWENNGTLYQPGDPFNVTEDVTFTAKWEEIIYVTNYTLTFNTNGGTAIAALTDAQGTVVDLSTYTPTKTGYTFGGWCSDEALAQNVTSITLDSNKTVYAKWNTASAGGGGGGGGGAVSKYTITFNNVDGTEIESAKYEANTTVDLGKYVPEKEGYKFEGWYTDKELTTKVTSIKLTDDTELYAKWVKNDDVTPSKPNYHPEILTTEHYAYIVGREGNRIEPKANITRAEVATIFFRLLTEEVRNENITRTNIFDDVNENDWFNTAVSTLANLGIIKGRSVNAFEPKANITRAEFTTIAAKFSDVVYEGENLFTDIDGHWAKDYINTAASISWVVGENGIFRPDDNITRAEVMTLVNRVLNRIPESEADLLAGMTRWEDNADTTAWYYLAVQEATNSHNYEIKPDGVHEKWTELTENPNWAELER